MDNCRLGQLLISFGFWVWVGKDILALFLSNEVGLSKLGAVAAISMIAVFLGNYLGKRVNIKLRVAPIIFWLIGLVTMISVSILFYDVTAFSYFKFENLLVSIIMALIITRSIILNKIIHYQYFWWIGYIFGLLGGYLLFNFGDIDSYIGLRSLSVAHLNIQDYYAVLFLLAIFLYYSTNRRNILIIILSLLLCLPILYLFNSRMIPFTLGVSAFSMVGRKKLGKSLILVILIFLMAHILLESQPTIDNRLLSVFNENIFDIFISNPRYLSFEEAINNFTGNPFFGIGFGLFQIPGEDVDVSDRLSGVWPHNFFLELLAEMGVIGFVLIGVPVLVLFFNLLRGKCYKGFGYVVFIYTFLTYQLTHNLWYPLFWVGIFWTIFDNRMRDIK